MHKSADGAHQRRAVERPHVDRWRVVAAAAIVLLSGCVSVAPPAARSSEGTAGRASGATSAAFPVPATRSGAIDPSGSASTYGSAPADRSSAADRPATDELPAAVLGLLQQTGIPVTSLAVVAFPLHAPGSGLRLHADQSMAPASTMKLVTAAVALDQLGPNSRGRTELLVDSAPALPATTTTTTTTTTTSATARVNGLAMGVSGAPPTTVVAPNGRLAGPLYLKGQADADLNWPELWSMLRELRERHGIRDLAGGVVVDRSLFLPSRPELGAPPFDELPEFPYNVIPDALHLGGALLRYDLQSDEHSLRARVFPDFGGLVIDSSQVRLVNRACSDWEDGWKSPQFDSPPQGPARVVLQGEFPRHCTASPLLNLVDRQWATAQALRQLWTSLGGTLTGDVREGPVPSTARVLVRHQDRPLAELLRPVLKASDNTTTRLIFNRLGAAAALPGEDTATAAARTVQGWLATQGIDPRGLVLDNGAGLSRTERLSAAQLAALLQVVQRGRWGPELLAALPIAGVDGTLSRRMKGTPAEGRARLKTGTLRDVAALAGYVPDAQQRPWVLVAFVNDPGAPRARPILDALAVWVSQQ